MNSITRSQFRAAIEAGIAASGDEVPWRLGEVQRHALREVADAALKVGIGSYELGPGCPLYQASLPLFGSGSIAFAMTFDGHMRQLGVFDHVVDIEEDA